MIPRLSKILKIIKIEVTDQRNSVLLKLQSLWWTFPVSGTDVLPPLLRWCSSTSAPQPTPRQACRSSEEREGGFYGEALWGGGGGGGKVSRWKTTRCRSCWRRPPDPLRSSLLRRARGRPACCRQQGGAMLLVSHMNNCEHERSSSSSSPVTGKHSLKQVRIQTLQDHFILYSHNWNSLWRMKHALRYRRYIYIYFFLFFG